MEKHDIWIQIYPKPTHDHSLWMNQMKICWKLAVPKLVRNTSPEKKSLAPKFIITRNQAKRLTVESSPFTEISTKC